MKKEENLEISPISGKKSVIVETLNGKTSKVCMDTGYMTNNDFSFDNKEILKKYEESMPQIIIDTKYKDDDLQQFWYLTSIHFKTGMIYPMPNSHNEYDWAFSPIIEISGDERLKYPKPGKDGEYYDSKLDTDATERYSKDDFRGVCKRAGAVIEL